MVAGLYKLYFNYTFYLLITSYDAITTIVYKILIPLKITRYAQSCLVKGFSLSIVKFSGKKVARVLLFLIHVSKGLCTLWLKVYTISRSFKTCSVHFLHRQTPLNSYCTIRKHLHVLGHIIIDILL